METMKTKVRKTRVVYTEKENEIIMEGRENHLSFNAISNKIKTELGLDRTAVSLMAHCYKLRKKKTKSLTSNVHVKLHAECITPPAVTYKNKNGELKQHTRELLVNTIFDNEVDNMSILSLPADNFLFEKQLKAQFQKRKSVGTIDFLCVEHNEAVYNKGLSEAMDNDFHYVKANMKDVLFKLKKTFTTIWLDFCCQYKEAVVECLQITSNNDLLENNGILALTLMYGREMEINALIPFLKNDEQADVDTLRFKAFPRYICDIIFHGKLKLQRILKYHDLGEDNQASPMLIYIFQKTDVEFEKKGVIELKYKSI